MYEIIAYVLQLNYCCILSHLTYPWLQFAVKITLLCLDHPLYPATTSHPVCMMMSSLLKQKGQSFLHPNFPRVLKLEHVSSMEALPGTYS